MEHHAPSDGDHPHHWEMYAEAMDLTIEGHRLIAEEIIHESRVLWHAARAWVRDLAGTRRRASPPV